MSDKWVADITVLIPVSDRDNDEIRKVTLFGSTIGELLDQVKQHMADFVIEIHIRRTNA
jgi:hypothetical protein